MCSFGLSATSYKIPSLNKLNKIKAKLVFLSISIYIIIDIDMYIIYMARKKGDRLINVSLSLIAFSLLASSLVFLLIFINRISSWCYDTNDGFHVCPGMVGDEPILLAAFVICFIAFAGVMMLIVRNITPRNDM